MPQGVLVTSIIHFFLLLFHEIIIFFVFSFLFQHQQLHFVVFSTQNQVSNSAMNTLESKDNNNCVNKE